MMGISSGCVPYERRSRVRAIEWPCLSEPDLPVRDCNNDMRVFGFVGQFLQNWQNGAMIRWSRA